MRVVAAVHALWLCGTEKCPFDFATDGGSADSENKARMDLLIEISPADRAAAGFSSAGFASLFLAICGPRRPRCPTPDRPQARTYTPNYSACLAVLQNR